jgi:hypothetical protein
MGNTIKAQRINGGLLGASSVMAGFSGVEVLLHFTRLAGYGYSFVFVMPVFAISLPVMVYTFYNSILLWRKRQSEAAKEAQ